jgi:hypothetical protein
MIKEIILPRAVGLVTLSSALLWRARGIMIKSETKIKYDKFKEIADSCP